MSGYEPTVGDLWPNEKSMPPVVAALLTSMHRDGARRAAEIAANPKHFTKSWYQVDRTSEGVVVRVWANKPTGKALGLWMFGNTIDDSGAAIIEVTRSAHVDEFRSQPVEFWTVSAEISGLELVWSLADLVGMRTAKAVVARLRPPS